MLDRHKARLCHQCRAPMARQSDRCWRCHATSSKPAAAPRRSLRQSTEHVLRARARRQADGARRDRRATTRTSPPRSPKTSA
jgi:hypothetical protein